MVFTRTIRLAYNAVGQSCPKERGIVMPVFTNQASLIYNDVVIDSNIVTGEIIGALTAAKESLTETYQQGDTVTYVVSILNSADTPYTGLVITDDLGAYTAGTMTVRPLDYVEGSLAYYSNGILIPASADADGDTLVITGISVPANGNAVVIYQARVNQFAPLAADAEITNTAVITGAGLAALITVSDTITAASAPQLSITKSLSPETVVDNSEVTYTLTIRNSGNAPASGIVVSDVFDPILTDITVTYNGIPWTEPTNYTYDETTGEFRTAAGQITLPTAQIVQDPETGMVSIIPSTAVIRITGTI